MSKSLQLRYRCDLQEDVGLLRLSHDTFCTFYECNLQSIMNVVPDCDVQIQIYITCIKENKIAPWKTTKYKLFIGEETLEKIVFLLKRLTFLDIIPVQTE